MEPASTLADCLAGLGFQAHTLTRNALGHFQIAGELAGDRVDLLVDTGAASTVVDLGYCRTRGLPLQDTGGRGGGAGGADLPIFRLPDLDLALGGTSLRANGIYALDLTHVNGALVKKGAAGVHAILGADVLTGHRAVIDYAGGTLYLAAGSNA